MTALLVVVVQVFACIGYGAALLRALSLHRVLPLDRASVIAFAIGSGILGWLLFPMGVGGWLGTLPLVVLMLAGCAGLATLPAFGPVSPPADRTSLSHIEIAIVAALFVAIVFDFIEGLTPPADADSLTYHFAIPKMFVANGVIDFVPVAVDGAVPLLVQLTYLPAFALGGERAMTLWVFVSGWFAVALVYGAARRLLDRPWSLTVALIFVTTPAVVYGAGSGQVEMRAALFAVGAALAIALANKVRGTHADLALIAVAGLCSGFCAAGKYFGLALVAAAGLIVLFDRRWFMRGTVFGGCALLAGFQWYAWNWIHTGDPFFPALFDLLGRPQVGIWTHESQVAFKSIFQYETGVPASLFWLVAYPLKATINGLPIFESGRTGFGPLLLLIGPFALAGLWLRRGSIRSSDASIYLAIAGLFYVLWFFSGISQRIRHLLPVLPLVLIACVAAAERWAVPHRAGPAVVLAAMLTVAIQLAGHALFTIGSARHLMSGQSREAYYAQTIPFYEPIAWINKHLDQNSKVITEFRWYNYLVDIPIFIAQPYKQAAVDLQTHNQDFIKFAQQIKNQGITHVVALAEPDLADPDPSTLSILSIRLTEIGCLRPIQDFRSLRMGSRTLRMPAANETPLVIYNVVRPLCPAMN